MGGRGRAEEGLRAKQDHWTRGVSGRASWKAPVEIQAGGSAHSMREASSTHKRKARMGYHHFATPKVLGDLGIDRQLLTAPKMETTRHYEP